MRESEAGSSYVVDWSLVQVQRNSKLKALLCFLYSDLFSRACCLLSNTRVEC